MTSNIDWHHFQQPIAGLDHHPPSTRVHLARQWMEAATAQQHHVRLVGLPTGSHDDKAGHPIVAHLVVDGIEWLLCRVDDQLAAKPWEHRYHNLFEQPLEPYDITVALVEGAETPGPDAWPALTEQWVEKAYALGRSARILAHPTGPYHSRSHGLAVGLVRVTHAGIRSGPSTNWVVYYCLLRGPAHLRARQLTPVQTSWFPSP